MKVVLTGQEIIEVLAKHASKEFPELTSLDGKRGTVKLRCNDGEFFAEIEGNP